MGGLINLEIGLKNVAVRQEDGKTAVKESK